MNINNNKKNQYDDLTVYYANELARICSKFNLEEEKILHLIFSQIKPYEKNDTFINLVKLDFFNKLELESENKYNRYRKLIYGLIKKTFIEIKDLDGDDLIGVVISSSKWNKDKPFFTIEISRMFMPYLEQLIKEYTKLELNSILKLKSKHSLSLYKWLCSWTNENHNENQRYVTTKDLKQLLGLSIDTYVQNGKFNRADFERYTIKRAIHEINEKTNIIVKCKKNKKGNFVQNYEFTWTQKEENSKGDKKSKLILNKKINSKQNLTLGNNIDKDNQVVFDKG